jgi:hypothetical protein
MIFWQFRCAQIINPYSGGPFGGDEFTLLNVLQLLIMEMCKLSNLCCLCDLIINARTRSTKVKKLVLSDKRTKVKEYGHQLLFGWLNVPRASLH